MSPRCALVLAVLSCSSRTPHPADAPPGDSFELDAATEEARPDPAERLETADPGGPVVPPLCVPAGEEGLPVPVQDFFAPESETRPFPNLAGSHTAVLAQFSPAEHAFLLVNDNPEQDPALLHRGQAQATHFFRTFFDAGVPEVTDPYAADPRTVASPAR